MSNKIALQTFFHIEDFTYQSSIFNILSKFHSNLFSRFFFKNPKNYLYKLIHLRKLFAYKTREMQYMNTSKTMMPKNMQQDLVKYTAIFSKLTDELKSKCGDKDSSEETICLQK